MGTTHPGFELLSAYRDGETTPAEVALVSGHLHSCSACRNTVASFDALDRTLTAVPTIACGVALPLISAQLDGEASPHEAAIAGQHLRNCPDCGAARASWQALGPALAALPSGVPSAATDARIRALAHRRRPAFGAPRFGDLAGRGALRAVAVAAVLVMLVSIGLQPGRPAQEVGITPAGEIALVASVQQVFDPGTGLLYTLQGAPSSAVVVRSVATQRDVATISVGGAPAFMALNTEIHTLYVVDPLARAYIEIDTEQQTVRDRVSLAVAGTPTTIRVDAGTGKLVVTTAASLNAPTPKGAQLAVFDPTSRTLDSVQQLDVTPIAVVLAQKSNRLFLLGATSTDVLSAATYERIDRIDGGALSIAASATGGADAILSRRGATARLSFYRGSGSADFAGTPVSVVPLPDGGFAVLYDVVDGGRIALVAPDGTARGLTFAVPGSARGLGFDPQSQRFFDASGAIVASAATGTIVAVVAPTQPPSPPPSAASTTAPQTTPAAAPTVVTAPPAVVVVIAPTTGIGVAVPTPAPSLFPGAILSSVGLYRYEMAGGVAPLAVVSGAGGRIWFAGADGTIRTVDPATGAVGLVKQLGSDARVGLLAYGGGRLFALDTAHGTLFTLNTADLAVQQTGAPFGRSITGIDVGPDGRLWLATSAYSGLVVYDPRTTQYEFVAIGRNESPTAVSVDGANRVWFYDRSRSAIGSYEPSTKLLTYLYLPASDQVTAVRADRSGNVWLGTAAGAVSKVFAGALTSVSTAGGSVVAFAPTPDGSVVALYDVGLSTLFGRPGGGLTVASGGVHSLAVDGYGRAWLGDSARPVFYVSDPR